jgi:hypothetical protein
MRGCMREKGKKLEELRNAKGDSDKEKGLEKG